MICRPNRQAVWEERLRGLGASSIHEETVVLIPVQDDLSEFQKLQFFGEFLDADAKAECIKVVDKYLNAGTKAEGIKVLSNYEYLTKYVTFPQRQHQG
jgi:hypothetical protein